MDGAPASAAPRLAASMIPGPPPVAMTLSRRRSAVRIAPPLCETMPPSARAAAYHCACRPGPSSLILALPNTTTVDLTPQAVSASSTLENSSRNRTPRMEELSRKS